MKNQFRLLAILLCLCQVLCLFGCTANPSASDPTEPARDPKVIPWGADGPIAEQAKAAGEMIICFMSGEETKISGGDSSTAYSDTKWGDSTLIAFPNGELMLIDGGMSDYAPLLIENLQYLGVTRLDYVVLSHRHNDHYGGLLRLHGVLDSFEIGVVYTSGVYNGNASDPLQLEGKTQKLGIPHEILRKGDVKNIGGVTMEVLWPQPELIGTNDPDTEDVNSSSLVLRFDYGERSALFAGDLYISGEQALINDMGAEKLDVDILKIPHHGRSTSSCRNFVETVSPEVAVALGAIIMETTVYTTYARFGARVFMDVYDGYVIVRTNGTDLHWETSRVRDVAAYDKLDAAFKIDRNSPG